MVSFVLGTSAELIKIWPVYRQIALQGNPVEIWSANQQPIDLRANLEDLKLAIDLNLSSRTTNLEKRREVPQWAASVLALAATNRTRLQRRLRRDGQPGLIIVHGDTMTTVLGCLLSRILAVDVAHIEAGLRSWNLRDPFPEELNRRIVSRLVNLHFAPDETSVNNLRGTSGEVICTNGNTIADALRNFFPQTSTGDYFLVSLHRSEFLNNISLLRKTFQVLIDSAKRIKVVLILDSVTKAALTSQGLIDQLQRSQVSLMGKLPYKQFVHLLASARAVITDSGGLQEECAAIGKPCLVFRNFTERSDGIGDNVVLSGTRTEAIEEWFSSVPTSQSRSLESEMSPTNKIVGTLRMHGYIK